MLHLPFAWLPAMVVPLRLLAHLAAIRRLRMGVARPADRCQTPAGASVGTALL